MSRLRRDDRGIAALELAIVTTVLLLLAFGALPLYAMTRAYQKVSKASGATLRYATSVASNGKRTAGGELSRRPTYDEIVAFARDAADDQTLVVELSVCRAGTCTEIADGSPLHAAPIPAVAGDTVSLTIRTTVDMSLIGRVANATTSLTGGAPVFPENDVTVASTAAAREE